MTDIFKDVEYIGKNKKNAQQGFNFRGIDDMYNELHNCFAKHEVFIISKVVSTKREERVTKSGGNLIYTVLEVEISYYAIDGSSVSTVLIGEAMDSADKSANKAMSAALKYALMQTFLIPTIELKDADETTPEQSAPAKVDLKAKNEESKLLVDASDALQLVTNLDELRSIWRMYPELHENTVFIKITKDKKQSLTPVTA